jgi:hypothetical protein
VRAEAFETALAALPRGGSSCGRGCERHERFPQFLLRGGGPARGAVSLPMGAGGSFVARPHRGGFPNGWACVLRRGKATTAQVPVQVALVLIPLRCAASAGAIRCATGTWRAAKAWSERPLRGWPTKREGRCRVIGVHPEALRQFFHGHALALLFLDDLSRCCHRERFLPLSHRWRRRFDPWRPGAPALPPAWIGFPARHCAFAARRLLRKQAAMPASAMRRGRVENPKRREASVKLKAR